MITVRITASQTVSIVSIKSKQHIAFCKFCIDNDMAQFDKTKSYASQEETFVGFRVNMEYTLLLTLPLVR